MDWQQEINVWELGVRLPNGNWEDVAGSPFQVMARAQDILGVMYVRIRPAYAAYWNEFMSDKHAGIEET
jgi:hypothetical protein